MICLHIFDLFLYTIFCIQFILFRKPFYNFTLLSVFICHCSFSNLSSLFNTVLHLMLEPNSYEKKAGVRVDGFQLGQDFVHLHQILQESAIYNSTGLYGPDVSQPKDHRKDLLNG